MDDARLRTGVWLFSDAPAIDLVEAIVVAEQAGIDEVWIADEGVPREPMPVLGYAAARTTRIALGLGITSPVLRHPGAIGSTASTLDELSHGRVRLGLGVGGVLSLAPFGLEFVDPVATLRDAIRISRGVIRREACEGYEPPSHAGPGRDVPIFVGARGEQLNRLASRAADGVFLSGFDLSRLATPISWARSVRPVHVALYASARFRRDAMPDPTVVRGGAHQIADQLRSLVEAHTPDTIGLALIDGDHPVEMVRAAAACFDALQNTKQ